MKSEKRFKEYCKVRDIPDRGLSSSSLSGVSFIGLFFFSNKNFCLRIARLKIHHFYAPLQVCHSILKFIFINIRGSYVKYRI
jgi:hypothetical protein